MNRAQLITSGPLAIFAVVLTSSGAWAGTPCASDAECPAGYQCNVTAVSGCAAPACIKGQECPPPPPCDVTEIRECTPGASCATDADCSPELRCLTSSYTTCTGSAVSCAKDAVCPPPPAPECHVTTVTQCVSRYQTSCASDAECGPGLNCVPSQRCTCPSVALPVDRGETKPPDSEPCVCNNDGPPICDLVNKTCAQTSDCPPNWECIEMRSGSCSVSRDGVETCEPETITKLCSTSYSGGYATGSDGSKGGGGEQSTSGGDTGSIPPRLDADAGPPTTGPGTPGTGTGTPPSDDHAYPWPSHLGGGIFCQFSGMNAASSPTGWSALLGLVGLAAMRRRRAAR